MNDAHYDPSLDAWILHCGFRESCSCGDCERAYPCLAAETPLSCWGSLRAGAVKCAALVVVSGYELRECA